MSNGCAAISLVTKAATNSGKNGSTASMELVCQKKPSEECSDGYHGLWWWLFLSLINELLCKILEYIFCFAHNPIYAHAKIMNFCK